MNSWAVVGADSCAEATTVGDWYRLFVMGVVLAFAGADALTIFSPKELLALPLVPPVS